MFGDSFYSQCSAPWSWSQPVTVSPSGQTERHISINPKDSLRYYFPTRVACVLLEVIRGATVRLPRVRGEVGTKSGRPCVCLLLAYPTSLLSRPAHLHTYQRCVSDVFNLFIGMIDLPPGLPSHSDRPNFPSQFYIPISYRYPLPQGRQVGFLK